MGGGFPIKAFGNDNLVLTKVGIVLTEVGNGQCITSLPNVYTKKVDRINKTISYKSCLSC